MSRAFVAIKPPEAVLDAVAARFDAVKFADARIAPRAQWHVTVQFLGDDADVDAIVTALDRLATVPGEVRLGAAGPLGNPRRATVFAAPLADGLEWMRGLAAEVASRLVPLGYQPDDRPFRPHLTLARTRRATRMDTAVAAFGPGPIGESWVVDEVTVYESRLGRGPAEHLVRAVLPLARNA